jgi:hypothetical protein
MLDLTATGPSAAMEAPDTDPAASQADRPSEVAAKAARHLPGPALRTALAAALVAAFGAFAWRHAAAAGLEHSFGNAFRAARR